MGESEDDGVVVEPKQPIATGGGNRPAKRGRKRPAEDEAAAAAADVGEAAKQTPGQGSA